MTKNSSIAALILAFFLGGLIVYSMSYRSSRMGIRPVSVWAADRQGEPSDQVAAIQSAYRRVSAELPAAVVEITVESEDVLDNGGNDELPWGDFFNDPSDSPKDLQYHRSRGMGSGVIIQRQNDSYYIVTNAHVIGKAQNISVRLNNGQSLTGRLAGKDDRKDLALIRIEYTGDFLPLAEFGDSDTLYVGDLVLAIGSPFGYENSVTSGIVSALGRRYGPQGNINDFIQTDASINQGNSGGPLVNIRGEIIGINTFITTPNSGSVGLGFATPANNVKTFIDQILKYGHVQYGWLGVSMGNFGADVAKIIGFPQAFGVMVYQVFIDSPADEAGLQAGDVILEFDTERYSDYEDLIYQIGDRLPGESVLFVIDRFGEQKELEVVLGKRGEEDEVNTFHALAWPGFVPAPLTDEVRDLMELPDRIVGVPVAVVYPLSVSQSIDLRVGDLVIQINDRKIDSITTMYRILGEIDRASLSMRVYRSGESIELKPKERE